jgi:undecaprenol kinase/diacylglycerol kinase (ATP)
MRNKHFGHALVHAFNGMKYFFLHERNGRIQLCCAGAVLLLAKGLGVPAMQCALLLLCIAMVIGLEMLNSALEQLCNVVQKEYHPVIKSIKDMAAGAVLWASVFAAAIGLYVLLPKLFYLL